MNSHTATLPSVNNSSARIPQSLSGAAGNGNSQTRSTGIASYSRFSSDNQSTRSVADQQRKCRQRAEADSLTLDETLQFSDEAVSGASHDRAGLDALMAASRIGNVQVLYVESLSRIARDLVLCTQILQELVNRHGVRVVAIDDGVDTANSNWELLSAFHSVNNQQYLRSLATSVIRGQLGVIHDGFAVGDHCYGYSSKPVEDAALQCNGKNAKPLMQYVVHEEQAKWVRKIFQWFTIEKKSMTWIVQELNKLKAPKGNRAKNTQWRHDLVAGILRNEKYVGIWVWGKKKNVRDPLNGKTKQVERAINANEYTERSLPELAIVEHGIFEDAQKRLRQQAELQRRSKKGKGTFDGSTARSSWKSPRHLLQGLLQCGECLRKRQEAGQEGQVLCVCGMDGTYLRCKDYLRGDCTCQTMLPRGLAEDKILEIVQDYFLSNEQLIEGLLKAIQPE